MTKLLYGNPPLRRPNLVAIAATVVSRSGLAQAAVKLWKNDPGIRKEFPDAGALYDHMNEFCRLPAEEKGDGQMSGTATKQDGAEYGLELYRKWEASGRPGTFTAFLEAEKTREEDDRRERVKAGGAR